MIIGPLGLRANCWRFSANPGRYDLVSAWHFDFRWAEPVVWAECAKSCPKDAEGHLMIQEDCSCGIYATLSPSVLQTYITSSNHMIALVEALDSDLPRGGNIWLHSSLQEIIGITRENLSESYLWGACAPILPRPVWRAGFTAPGVQMVYLVDVPQRPWYDKARLATAAAAEQLHLDVISLREALLLCQRQWELYEMPWLAEWRIRG